MTADRGTLTALTTVRHAFRLLVEHSPVTLDGWALSPDLPGQVLSLGEVADLLGSRATDRAIKDAIWAELIRLAQTGTQIWQIIAAGLLAPSLAATARRVVVEHGGDPAEIDSEVALGFIEALRVVDPSMRRLLPHLRRVAYDRAMSAVQPPSSDCARNAAFRIVPIAAPRGHIDLVLAEAIGYHVLTRVEAELIGRTRIEGLSLITAAEQLGLPTQQCREARANAEFKLHEFLRSPTYRDHHASVGPDRLR
ncbi:hypothetical protein [Amycolatopsis sp. WQ 127309]|uniref:hypothetical protein n=1 Tax=Amycolatopsis sp. WQ 127309 TaxID=2932773 RepID=UPI001FF4FCC2|nr:hypothetical protein [Amycolatopsis sp. WQ 127309]UOZ05684.1 hypothetical protein MUY22_43805 [Amycolatopsis sp. WQ 127309]